MFFEEQYLSNLFVLVIELITWADVLQLLAGLAAELPDEATSIAYKESSTFEPELTSRDIRFTIRLVKLGEKLLQGPSEIIVNSDIVRGEDIDLIGQGAKFEIEDVMEFVYLFRFLFQGWSAELGDLFLADQDLVELRDDLKTAGVNEDLLAVDELDGLEFPEVPNAHIHLVIKGEDIRVGLNELCPEDRTRMFRILADIALSKRNIKRIHIDIVAEPKGQQIISKLARIADPKYALPPILINRRTSLLRDMLECIIFLQLLRIKFYFSIH